MTTALIYTDTRSVFLGTFGSWAVRPGSGSQPIDGSQQIEYLNADGLHNFLRGSSKGTSGILQQFVESKVGSWILPALRLMTALLRCKHCLTTLALINL